MSSSSDQRQIYKICRIKKYGFVSLVIFSIILISSILLWNNLLSKNITILINYILVASALSGLVFCFMFLNELTRRIDDKTLSYYSELFDIDKNVIEKPLKKDLNS